MAYQFTTPRFKAQAIASFSATQLHNLGEIQQANDPTFGTGEFIYLKGVGSTIVGSPVTYSNFQTALAPVGTKLPQTIAFAMSACVANQFGWYQISGLAVAAKTSTISMAAGIAVGVKTIGLIATSGSGLEVQGALVALVAANPTATVTLQINRPHMQGRIT